MSAKLVPITRQLTVAYKSQLTSRGYFYANYTHVPFINLAGRWLEKAGFDIGDKIDISIENNRLIISKQTNPDINTV